MWMTNGQWFFMKLTQSTEILGLSAHLDIPKKLHTGRVMHRREVTPMYDPDSDFRAPKIEGILPYFAVLHKMRRKTLAPRIGDSDAILVYERNLLDAIMKNEHFDAFDYIIDEIWNIAINPQRSCGFAPYIMCMIEVVAHEWIYKDASHSPFALLFRRVHLAVTFPSSGCGSFSHYPPWWCLLLLQLQLRFSKDVLGYLCHVLSHRSAHGRDGLY
jgi:hypothetical protein